ncbi:phosphate acyltransferase [Mesoterricola silvestris]|uniref:phosphate acyltransferase n=1 Tax=Mesoterricola silvestris TaxID=2927979 RepID=UPI003742EA6E
MVWGVRDGRLAKLAPPQETSTDRFNSTPSWSPPSARSHYPAPTGRQALPLLDLHARKVGCNIAERFGGAMANEPSLQALAKPGNYLNRGRTAEDLAKTVILTVLQTAPRGPFTLQELILGGPPKPNTIHGICRDSHRGDPAVHLFGADVNRA